MAGGRSQRILEIYARVGVTLGVRQVAYETGLSRHAVAQVSGTLASRGLLSRVRTGQYRLSDAGRYFLEAKRVVTCGPCGPHTGKRKPAEDSLRARVWAALRSSGKATVADLVQLAAKGGEVAAIDNARRYLRALKGADYVAVLPVREPGTKPTSNGFLRYRLIRNTGPLAPIYRPSRREVWDPNTGESHEVRR